MKIRPITLRKISSTYCPDLAPIIAHESEITSSTWNQGLQTGKAVEFTSLCAIISAFRLEGCQVIIPEIYFGTPDMFYIRNTIPRHHGALAGHDATADVTVPLAQRFLGALTPKAIVETGSEKTLLIFREGHPFHFINYYKKNRDFYLDRPDIVISEGEVEIYPNAESSVRFRHWFPKGSVVGDFRIANHPNLPLKSLETSGSLDVPIVGIVECSVGKGRDKAGEQLNTYKRVFETDKNLVSLLVNGRKETCGDFDSEILLDLEGCDPSLLGPDLLEGTRSYVRKILLR